MLNFFTIILIFCILFFLAFLNRKYIFNAFKKKSYPIKKINNQAKIITSSPKISTIQNQHNLNKYSEYYKRTLRRKMLKLFEGDTSDKLKALKIAKELADKSTLPILRKGLKDMNLQIVESSARLISKFK